MTVDEADAKMREGTEMLDGMTVALVSELYRIGSDRIHADPEFAAQIKEQHDLLLQWREQKLAELESTLLAITGRLH